MYETFLSKDGKGKKKKGIYIWDSLGIVDIVLVPFLVILFSCAALNYFSKLRQGN